MTWLHGPPTTSPRGRQLSVAMLGTRGVPANYGGFETAIEEVGRRLVDRGHRVVVYSRGDAEQDTYLGMERVRLPALRRKQIETLSHTGLSVMHCLLRQRPDVAFVFNAANAPFLPWLRARRIPTALHMDGLEWKRAKWGSRGKRYYRWAEEFGVRWGDALIADAPGIRDYYQEEFGVPTELIRYGAKIITEAPTTGVRGLGLTPGQYHLVVARFEPENHVKEIVDGYRHGRARHPLVIVGSAPYAADYTHQIEAVAASDDRIRLLGGVWDQDLLDALYFHALTYVHGHSVGGTNPSLLRAIGAGTSVISYDVGFNSEIVDKWGAYFSGPREVTRAVEEAEQRSEEMAVFGAKLRDLARTEFDWDVVASEYEDLARRLACRELYGRHRKVRRRDPDAPGRHSPEGREVGHRPTPDLTLEQHSR